MIDQQQLEEFLEDCKTVSTKLERIENLEKITTFMAESGERTGSSEDIENMLDDLRTDVTKITEKYLYDEQSAPYLTFCDSSTLRDSLDRRQRPRHDLRKERDRRSGIEVRHTKRRYKRVGSARVVVP